MLLLPSNWILVMRLWTTSTTRAATHHATGLLVSLGSLVCRCRRQHAKCNLSIHRQGNQRELLDPYVFHRKHVVYGRRPPRTASEPQWLGMTRSTGKQTNNIISWAFGQHSSPLHITNVPRSELRIAAESCHFQRYIYHKKFQSSSHEFRKFDHPVMKHYLLNQLPWKILGLNP